MFTKYSLPIHYVHYAKLYYNQAPPKAAACKHDTKLCMENFRYVPEAHYLGSHYGTQGFWQIQLSFI